MTVYKGYLRGLRNGGKNMRNEVANDPAPRPRRFRRLLAILTDFDCLSRAWQRSWKKHRRHQWKGAKR